MEGGKAEHKIKPGRKLIHKVYIHHLIKGSYKLGSELPRSKSKKEKKKQSQAFKCPKEKVSKEKIAVFIK